MTQEDLIDEDRASLEALVALKRGVENGEEARGCLAERAARWAYVANTVKGLVRSAGKWLLAPCLLLWLMGCCGGATHEVGFDEVELQIMLSEGGLFPVVLPCGDTVVVGQIEAVDTWAILSQ